MRDYEFRGKRLDTGEWIYGFVHVIDTCGHGYTGTAIQQQFGTQRPYSIRVDKETVGQFTGLYDKNEVKIYDGDIVEAWSQGSKARGVIEQRIDGHWIMYPCWQNSEMWYLMPNNNGKTTVEVIDNIFEKEKKWIE